MDGVGIVDISVGGCVRDRWDVGCNGGEDVIGRVWMCDGEANTYSSKRIR